MLPLPDNLVPEAASLNINTHQQTAIRNALQYKQHSVPFEFCKMLFLALAYLTSRGFFCARGVGKKKTPYSRDRFCLSTFAYPRAYNGCTSVINSTASKKKYSNNIT
eukprot:1784321-Amphidinium_carterae.2